MSDVAARLEGFLAARFPDASAVQVEAVEAHTEGFSAETFSFTAAISHGARVERSAWVLKREPAAGLLEPYDLEPEFRVLHALSDDPLPSPRTPWFETDPRVLDRPFYVMERLAGEVPIPAAGASGEGPFDATERSALAVHVTRVLADLHAIDWKARGVDFLGAPAAGNAAALREAQRWSDRIDASGMPMEPVLAEALGWLRGHAPVSSAVALLHGDYRLGNWLIARDGAKTRVTGLLDWEMVHLGDPVEDLAWCTSHLWRGSTPRAACLASPDELVALYEVASGRAVDPAALRWYEVLSVVKMIAIMLTGIRAFADGRTRDLRMAIFDHQLPYLHALLAALRGWLPLP
jgi:aminoglycoside phosphotransferase (APT) family kinase protein